MEEKLQRPNDVSLSKPKSCANVPQYITIYYFIYRVFFILTTYVQPVSASKLMSYIINEKLRK